MAATSALLSLFPTISTLTIRARACVCVCVCVCLVAQSCPTLSAPWTPLSMEFSREEYWTELPFPALGDLPDSGIEPISLASPALAGGFLTTTWEAQ